MQELLHGAGVTLAYIIAMALLMLGARALIRIPDELFRKLLHFVLLGAYIPFLFAFETWWISAGFAALLIVVLFPVLILAAKIPKFSSFVNERKKGEFKSSMVLALGMMVVSISVCWGIFDDRYLVMACMYAWGVGDAFAALVGKRFGKHKIGWSFVDQKKSYEGSAAMIVTSALAVFTVLILRGGLSVIEAAVVSLVAATASAFVELLTKSGFDTVTCPAAAMAVIIPMLYVFGG